MTENKLTDAEKIYRRRWGTFSVLALTILIVVIDHTILNVALPTLQTGLGATMSELQWIVDAYILAFATMLLTMGTLGDRFGRATMLRIGLILFGLSSLFAVFSSSAGQLISARVFMGIGAAIMAPATLAIITNIFPESERGRAIAAWGAMNGAGIALGPLLGGLLLEYFDWNSIFIINIPIVVIALVAGYLLVPNSRDPQPRRPDIPGTVLSAVMMSLLVFGFIKGSDWGWLHPVVLGSLGGSLAAGFLFILREKSTDHPMIDLDLFSNPRLSSGAGNIAIMTIPMLGILFAFTLYMQFVKGYSPMETGIRFLPVAFGYAFGSITSNRSSRILSPKIVVVSGFIGMTLVAPVGTLLQADSPYWQLAILLFVFSFFLGRIYTPSMNAVLGAVPKNRAGVGSAIGNVAFQTGGALGVAALGSVISSIYKTNMDIALSPFATLPNEIISAARESIGGAVTAAGMLPDGIRQSLIAAASNSFMEGWKTILFVICGIGIIGVLLTIKFMPSSDKKRSGYPLSLRIKRLTGRIMSCWVKGCLPDRIRVSNPQECPVEKE